MNDTASKAKILGDSPDAVADAPLSSLGLPGRLLKLLEDDGFTNVGNLALRLEDEPKSILAIGGIGPKTLLNIQTALEAFASEPAEEYREPVQSLGDQFKSVPSAEPKVTEEKSKTKKKAKKDKKKKDKKPKKADKKKEKKPKKADKKKDKKPKKADKKKDKKSKKSKNQKDKKKKQKTRNKKSKK